MAAEIQINTFRLAVEAVASRQSPKIRFNSRLLYQYILSFFGFLKLAFKTAIATVSTSTMVSSQQSSPFSNGMSVCFNCFLKYKFTKPAVKFGENPLTYLRVHFVRFGVHE